MGHLGNLESHPWILAHPCSLLLAIGDFFVEKVMKH